MEFKFKVISQRPTLYFEKNMIYSCSSESYQEKNFNTLQWSRVWRTLTYNKQVPKSYHDIEKETCASVCNSWHHALNCQWQYPLCIIPFTVSSMKLILQPQLGLKTLKSLSDSRHYTGTNRWGLVMQPGVAFLALQLATWNI